MLLMSPRMEFQVFDSGGNSQGRACWRAAVLDLKPYGTSTHTNHTYHKHRSSPTLRTCTTNKTYLSGATLVVRRKLVLYSSTVRIHYSAQNENKKTPVGRRTGCIGRFLELSQQRPKERSNFQLVVVVAVLPVERSSAIKCDCASCPVIILVH